MADNNFKGGPGGRLQKEEAKNVNFGFMRPTISPLNQQQFMNVATGNDPGFQGKATMEQLREKMRGYKPEQTKASGQAGGYNPVNPIVFGQKPGSSGAILGKVLTLGGEPMPGQGYSFSPTETLKGAAFDFATGEAIGAGVKAAAPYVKAAYNKVATGNSILPIAWKLEKNMASPSQIAAIKNSANLTDEEAEVLSKYMNNPYSIAKNSRESEILASIPQKSYANLSGVNQPITKIQNYYVAEGANPQVVGKYGENVVYPRGRSWSLGAGRTEGYANTHRNTRLVIPSRYANKLEGFHAVDYNDPRFSFLAPEERELFGNVPEGFKVIGSSNEGGFKNIFIKPNRGVDNGVLQKIAKRMSF
jgi:hypothetical protein